MSVCSNRLTGPVAACALLLAGIPAVAPAQLGAEPETLAAVVENDRRIYVVEQFTRFAPQSAADMVGQIPGFSITAVSNNRGIGEATQNVLINGQRITGKGNDAQAVLRRIPVRAVLRLEIADGATLNIGGLTGDVLNVVTQETSVQGNFTWRPQIRERIPDHWSAGEVNVSGNTALGDIGLGFKWDGFRGGGWGRTREERADGEGLWRDADVLFANDTPELSGTFNRVTGAGSIWNLNASVNRQRFRRNTITRYQESGESPVTETSLGGNRRWGTEIGADYEFAAGQGRLKLVGFFSERDGPNVNEIMTLQDGASIPTGSRFTRDSTEGERVGRAEYRWGGWNADWTLSAEGAYNFIDATGTLEVRDSAGGYQPIALAGASSRVEEKRGESILGFSRALSGGWSVKASGGGEYSRLSQDSEGGRTRAFWRPKGSLALAWSAQSRWELNLKLQRSVAQLNFFDFLANVDVANNNTNASNPELVPPQIWLAQADVTRLLGPHGKVTFTVEAEDISDQVGQVPLTATLEAPGNLDSARRLQVKIDAGLLLDGIGIRGGKLDFFASVRDTSLRDPLTGRKREFNGNRSYWNVDFRHDVPGTAWTWGVFTELQSTNHSYRLDFEEHFDNARPFGSIFLEHKDVFGLKVRAQVANLFHGHERSRQISYSARRDGPIEYTRDYRLEFGYIYRLQVSGTF